MQLLLRSLFFLGCCFLSRAPLSAASPSSALAVHDPDDAGTGADSGRAQSCSPVSITVPMCQGISYSTTTDRLAFGKQSDAALALKQFDDFVQVPCAPFLRLFVCSMHLPFCNREQRLLVRPCREFCTRIRDLCSPVLLHFGYSWPVRLACDSLPPEDGSGSAKNLCLRPRVEDFEAELASLQRQQPNLLSSIEERQRQQPPHQPSQPPPTLAAMTRQKNGSSPGGAARSPPAGPRRCSAAEVRLGPEPNSSCAPRCHASLQFFAEDKQFATVWMQVWSVLCLLCTGLAVTTFLLDGDRFCFPERPIVWVAASYALYSAAHILRAVLGPDLACSSHQVDGARDVQYRVSRYAGHWCAAVFLLLYFSWLAGLLWWLALTVCWYLCAVKKWAHEALSAKAVWLHLLAWGAPLLLSVLLLVLHRIEADELTHLCVVDGSRPVNLLAFVILPCAVALFLGLGFLACALCSTITVRNSLKCSGNLSYRRLEKLMTKIGLFSFLFVLPTVCVLAANIYEYSERDRWTESLERILARPECADSSGIRPDSGNGCSPEHRPSSALYMLKIFMSLAAGLPSGLVVWVNGKSAVVWRSCFYRVLLRRKATGGSVAKPSSQTYTTIDSFSHCAVAVSASRASSAGRYQQEVGSCAAKSSSGAGSRRLQQAQHHQHEPSCSGACGCTSGANTSRL